eukprot:CAMPEP_0202866220 /NCGR_PEP_ID=MMETSP1391-20130828/7267_1 /ASSEMBLY_ACC=CAM_ASM_000867 /TAXON_ID=1034604 /ORGANISM="Chlamydomonas leiostraca, Strain SAG 11-49" /LENGTH=558 /DNA_ID=CAMNT_0049546153 /DNA_START=111 /DNA_END=1787 /DNA_ORIENTATION=-
MAQGMPGLGEVPPTKNLPVTEDADNPIYKQDQFRMYCLKVLPCSKRYCHDWTTCPFAHPAEKAKRRDPRVYQYTGVACPEMKKNLACPRGDACPYAHNVFEYWLHPSRYRTQLCNDGVQCKRKICFFAHTLDELRVSSVKVLNPDMAGRDGFGETGGLDPFAIANDTGFGLARSQQPAASATPGFSLQDLQQLTHLHAKLQAASNMGALNSLLSQQVQGGVSSGDGGQGQLLEQLAQALAQQQQVSSPPQQHQQQQANDLVGLISQMLVANQQQQQQQSQQQAQQQQAQQQAAAAAAVAAAQSQAALQLLSQLQGGGGFNPGMGDQMPGYAGSPMHMPQGPVPRPGMPPALLQQQLAAQMAAQSMAMGNPGMHARPPMQGMGMSHRSPSHQGSAPAPMPHHQQAGNPYGNSRAAGMPMEADALAQRLAGMNLPPGAMNMASSPRQMPMPHAMQQPGGPGLASSPLHSRTSAQSSVVIGDHLATSPTGLAHPGLVQRDSVHSSMPLPDMAGTAGTATTYFSNSHSPASTDHSDAASHHSDHSDTGSAGVTRTLASPFHL